MEAGAGGKKWNREGEEVGIGGWEGGGNRGTGRTWGRNEMRGAGKKGNGGGGGEETEMGIRWCREGNVEAAESGEEMGIGRGGCGNKGMGRTWERYEIGRGRLWE